VPSVVKGFQKARTTESTETQGKHVSMGITHTPDPIVDPERLFEGFEKPDGFA
jgi:hypothetical protein